MNASLDTIRPIGQNLCRRSTNHAEESSTNASKSTGSLHETVLLELKRNSLFKKSVNFKSKSNLKHFKHQDLSATMDVQIQTMMVRLGLTQATAQYLVNTEGVATPKAISQLDDKMIETLSKNCRKQTPKRPAGRVSQRGRNNAGQDLQLGTFQQRSLTLMSFFVKCKFMTSREIPIESITPETMEEIDGFERHISTMENPSLDGIPKLTKSRKFEFFDEFTEFLNDILGAVSLRPLGYVVRKVAAVPDSATQEPFGHADSPFGSSFKEIEARAPIMRLNQAGQASGKDRHFNSDNIAVWKLPYATVKDTEFHTHQTAPEEAGWKKSIPCSPL